MFFLYYNIVNLLMDILWLIEEIYSDSFANMHYLKISLSILAILIRSFIFFTRWSSRYYNLYFVGLLLSAQLYFKFNVFKQPKIDISLVNNTIYISLLFVFLSLSPIRIKTSIPTINQETLLSANNVFAISQIIRIIFSSFLVYTSSEYYKYLHGVDVVVTFIKLSILTIYINTASNRYFVQNNIFQIFNSLNIIKLLVQLKQDTQISNYNNLHLTIFTLSLCVIGVILFTAFKTKIPVPIVDTETLYTSSL